MRKMPLGDVEDGNRFEMSLKPLAGAKPRGLAAFKQVQKQHQQATASKAAVPAPMKMGCMSVWAIAGLFLFTIMRPAGDPIGEATATEQPQVLLEPSCADRKGGCDKPPAVAPSAVAAPARTSAQASSSSPAVDKPVAATASTVQTTTMDGCGCATGFGWSVSTGRGCCKSGSLTQDHELASCQAALGNTDCTAADGDLPAPADDCGCLAGFGWSVSTGRGCCKKGSVTQEKEVAECQAALGNVQCDGAAALPQASTGTADMAADDTTNADAAETDGCGCAAGFGWSVTTGRGCCKSGSLTQDHELSSCQAALGNTDCALELDKVPTATAVGATEAKDTVGDVVDAVALASCTGGGAGREVYLHTLTEDNSRVGYGRLGKGDSLGFEGIKAKVEGVAYEHILSMHPGGGQRGIAVVDYHLPAVESAVAGDTEEDGSAARWCTIEGKTAINDKNNFFGKVWKRLFLLQNPNIYQDRLGTNIGKIEEKDTFLQAGSPLTFTVYDATACAVEADGKCKLTQADGALQSLWRSEPVQYTETVQNFRVELPQTMSRLRLEVAAAGSNACAHAVWLDPKLEG